MANSRIIEFKGHFDGKQVLDELKKIRQSMADAGADDNLFKGIDKDIATTEKLVTEMMAQIQKGFSNTKEVNAFEKQIDKLQTNFLKISSGMQNINIAENFGLNSPEITSLTRELEQLTAAQDHLKEVSKEALDQAKKSVGLRDDEIAKIKEAIDANEDLEEALKKVGKAKEKRFLSQAGEAGMQTQAGKDYIKNADAGLSLSDLGAKASSGNTAKAKNDARKRYDDGELYGDANNRQLDEVKAAAAVTEAYQKTLEKMITSGGNAAEAVEEMKKSLADYGIEIENTDQLQENFYNDIEGFYKSPAVERGNKGNITKARKIGRTNAQGEYELSDASVQNFLNNSGVTAYADNMRRATEVTNQLGQEIEEATRRTAELVNENDVGLNNAIQNTNNMADATKKGAEATKEASESVENMNNAFDNMKSAIKTFLSINGAVSALRNVVRDTYNDIKELDKSFADIAMVTDYSVQEMWSSYDQYAAMANELGQSTQSVIQASGLFYQQGLDTADSLALTEDTMKLATLAGLDFAEATSQMTAALRGFHMEMDEGGRVTDVYSELAAKAAADVEGIAYAMSKTASIASSAGMEFETTSAFLTQMIETTQEAPENIGTAMKTIIARFTELKENVAGTGDSEFEDLDYNKVDTALKSVGVSIKDASGQFRDLDDVFLELSQKWNTLDRNSQRYIATIAAGSRQQSRFIAMMENYDRTMELVDTAYDSAGKSSEQFAKYQDTIEYKMNQLQNTWEQFRAQFFNSNFFKTIIDGLNSVVSKIEDLDGKDIIALGATFILVGKTVIQYLLSGIQAVTLAIPKGIEKALASAKGKFVKGLGIGINTEEVERQIEIIKEKIKAIEREKVDLEVESKEAMAELEMIKKKVKEVKDAGGQVKVSGENRTLVDQNGNALTDEQGNALTMDRMYSARRTINQNTPHIDSLNRQINSNQEYEQNLEKTQQKAQQAGAAIGNAFATTLLTTITTITTEADPGAAFITIFIGGLTSVLPMLISVLGASVAAAGKAAGGMAGDEFQKAFVEGGGPVALIIMAIVAAIALVTAGVLALNKAAKEKTLEYRLENAKKQAEQLEKSVSDLQKTFDELNDATETLEDISENFDKLANKTVRTSEEQEQYEKYIESIKEEYPEIISYYDEEAGKMIINNDLLSRKLELLEKEKEIQEKNLELEENRLIAANTNFSGLSLASEFVSNANFKGEDASLVNLADIDRILKGQARIIDRTQNGESRGNQYYKQIGDVSLSTDSLTSMIGAERELTETEAGEVYDFITKTSEEVTDYTTELKNLAANLQDAFDDKDLDDISNILLDAKGTVDEYKLKLDDHYQAVGAELHEAFKNYFSKNEKITDIGQEFGAALGKVTQEEYSGVITQISDINKFNTNDDVENAAKIVSDYQTAFGAKIFDEKDIKTALDEITSGANVSDDYSDFSNETKKFLATIGIETADQYLKYMEDSEGDQLDDPTAVRKMLEDYILAINENLSKQLSDVIINYQNEMESLYLAEDLSLEEWNKEYKELMGENGIIWNEIRRANPNISEDEIKQMMENLNNFVGKETIANLEESFEGIDNIETISVSSLKTLSEKISGYDGAIPSSVKDVINGFKLTSDEINILASMDWDSDIRSLLANSSSYIEALKDAGNDTTEATNKFKNIAQDLAYAVGNIVTNSLTYDQLLEDSISGYAENGFGIEAFLSSFSEIIENGTISAETFASNYDLLKDYTQFRGNGEDITLTLTADVKDVIAEKTNLNIESYIDQLENTERTYKEAFNATTKGIIEGSGNLDEYLEDQEEFFKKYEDLTAQEKAVISMAFNQGITNYNDAKQEFLNTLGTGYEDALQLIEFTNLAFKQQIDDFNEQVNDLQEQKNKLLKQKEQNEKSVEDAFKAYQETQFGTEFWQASSDGLYNYEQQLDKVQKKIEKMQETLKKSTSFDDAAENVTSLINQIEEQSLLRQAESSVIDTYLKDNLNTLRSYAEQYGEFYTTNEDGSLNIDFQKLENIAANDKIRENIEETLTQRNEFIQKQQELDDQEQEQMQQFIDLQKELLDQYVSIQENMASILEEQAKKEVEDLKEKYNSMKEVDNDYLDALAEAIEKQRELRERENQYENLAQQRKKLSLMQRDTSGSNQKEQLELEKSIQNEEQNLLDTEIDNMIDSMKELQQTQQEEREAIIENKEAVIENTNFLKQASEIQSTFKTQEDYVNWMLQNSEGSEDWSVEKTEQMIGTWEEEYGNMAAFINLHNVSIEEAMQHTESEILNKSSSISNGIETDASDSMTQVKTEVTDAISDAKDKWEDAKDTLKDTETELGKVQKSMYGVRTATQSVQLAWKQFVTDSTSMIQDLSNKLNTANLENAMRDRLDQGSITKDEFVKQFGTDASSKALAEETWNDYINNSSITSLKEKGYSNEIIVDKAKKQFNTIKDIGSNVVSGLKTKIQTGIKSAAIKSEKRKQAWDDLKENLTLYNNAEEVPNNRRDGYYKISSDNGTYYIKPNPDLFTKLNQLRQSYGELKITVDSYGMWRQSSGFTKQSTSVYKQGGLVDYTGPAWVDGTPTKPEAFLNAQDTQRIGEAAKILAQIPALNGASENVSTNIGDTTIEIHINVESIESDYDVDQMIERVKNDILDVSKPTGTSVILKK